MRAKPNNKVGDGGPLTPKLKQDANPRAISACVATKQAHQWLKACDCYFDSIAYIMLGDGKRLPMTTTLIVTECYDFEEVWTYVPNKPWVRQA